MLAEDNSIYETEPGGRGGAAAQNVTAMLVLHSITTVWSGKQGRNTEMGESNEARGLKVKGRSRKKRKQEIDEIDGRRKTGRLRYVHNGKEG